MCEKDMMLMVSGNRHCRYCRGIAIAAIAGDIIEIAAIAGNIIEIAGICVK